MLCTNIRRIRLAKGIRGDHIAGFLGVTRQQYANKEAGRSSITTEDLIVISKAIGEIPGIFFDDRLTESVIKRLKGERANANKLRKRISREGQSEGHESSGPSIGQDSQAVTSGKTKSLE